uniref:Putative sigma 54 modulation protein/ribosomal protein S30EA n=1 Tax=Magnetococcus massalia (strain MO-1) TaxID=451514 RepID=A0A1S7LLL0_MAGMO|nr:putative sigma 54 modulation protein/ribosomal protein S30EA [Candidatus Magnetococcus massalia]
MELKLEGRQLDIGNELRDRITKRMETLNNRFGPITHARVSIERKAHNNEQRAEVKTVVNVTGQTIAATKEAPTVMPAVNDALDTLTHELQSWAERTKKSHA